MKATDFNFPKEIEYRYDQGLTTFRDNRLLMFDANSIGLLRQSTIERLGKDEAKRFFFKFGFQNGYSDFMQMNLNYEFESEMDLLASGPVIHTWQGIVHASPSGIDYCRDSGKFSFTGVWKNSYEAEQHLMFNDHSEKPVCWSLTGYASGWCTAFFGKTIIAKEPVCKGKGDAHCEWDLRTVEEWGDEAQEEVSIIKELNLEVSHG